MRSFVPLTVFCVCLTLVTTAYCQNNVPPSGQPAGPGPGAAPGDDAGPGALPGAGATDPNYRAQVSYALGRNFASQLKDGEIDCDANALMQGISDVLTNAKPKWSEEQLNACLQRFGREMQQKETNKMQQQAMKNQQEETAFLAQNGKREGVQTTPSGLQYRVVQQGKGASPTLSDTVKCNYKGTLINGTEFDSSARHGGPAEFPVQGVISGWTEALQKMHVGDKWQLFVPAKLAYGMNPPGPPIEAGSLLVFEIELLDIAKK
jgi:FKBP-type peptidyl-prolyl cis-trans isomerase FklB